MPVNIYASTAAEIVREETDGDPKIRLRVRR